MNFKTKILVDNEVFELTFSSMLKEDTLETIYMIEGAGIPMFMRLVPESAFGEFEFISLVPETFIRYQSQFSDLINNHNL